MEGTNTKYVNLYVSGPWYKHGTTKSGIAPPGTIVKYGIYELDKYFPYIKTTGVMESFPAQTDISVPKDKVKYVMSELESDNYDVTITTR